ncbi:MAG: hypothetical protein GF344_05520, partial [Chitinivibrionales bacterium]|nr:hypothetical protein [Chitinivibrionales bacterium]MBD3356429.1 hypothetical protein [Chitinivibrionales bacterium]
NVLERDAAGLAADIFAEISANSDAAFGELADDFGKRFASVVDDKREVRMSGLDNGAISLSDAGGTIRSLETLSGGTRECFVFAARLALARRAAEDAAVLVLDEPFLTLDDARRRRAVTMLKRFWEDTKWQIVVLTKDHELAQLVADTFKTVGVVENRLRVGS